MSDQQQEVRGPVMLCATQLLSKPPPTRIGRVSNNITLPRTVQLSTAVAALVGGLVGGFLSLLFATIEAFVIMVFLGGAAGVGMVSWSPMRGESTLTWLRLTVDAQRRGVDYQGRRVRLYVGICPVLEPARGQVQILRGAVPVPPGSVDERGVPRTRANGNLPSAPPTPPPATPPG